MKRPIDPVEVIGSIAAIACATVGWLDWVASGAARRNSYEMFRSLQRLGLDELTPIRVIWFLVPVAALAALCSLLLRHRRVAAALLVVDGVVVGAAALVVLVAGVRAGSGSIVGVVAAVTAIGSAIGLVRTPSLNPGG